MEGYRPETYGDRIAGVYDAMMTVLPDPAEIGRASCRERVCELV